MSDGGEAIAWRLLRADTAETSRGSVVLDDRPRSVLLRLLIEPNQMVSTALLADFIWGSRQPKTAVNSVARFVADLRRSLGPDRHRIETVGSSYRVVVRPGELDVERAREIIATSRDSAIVDLPRCRANLVVGLDLVGSSPNPALINLPDTTAILRAHYELRIAMLELHVEIERGVDHSDALIATLEQAVSSHPLHEGFWIDLMQTLTEAGRRPEALRAGQRARALLAEAGLEPQPRFTKAEADIAVDGDTG